MTGSEMDQADAGAPAMSEKFSQADEMQIRLHAELALLRKFADASEQHIRNMTEILRECRIVFNEQAESGSAFAALFLPKIEAVLEQVPPER
jgi:adenylosuccinate lyase